jgi:hypothetical protein
MPRHHDDAPYHHRDHGEHPTAPSAGSSPEQVDPHGHQLKLHLVSVNRIVGSTEEGKDEIIIRKSNAIFRWLKPIISIIATYSLLKIITHEKFVPPLLRPFRLGPRGPFRIVPNP